MINRILLTLLFTISIIFVAGAQEATTYPPDGVYSSFSAFRAGKPSLTKDQMVKSGSQEFTIRQWVNSEKLLFRDASGEPVSFERRDFWGYVENGTLYIFLGNKFHKITVLGSISYFLESYPTVKGNPSPVVTESRATSAYRLLDMETGDILDYDISNLQQLLEPDEELFNEFKAIVSQKTKRKRMYSYMERYNKKYPLKAFEVQ